MTFLRGYPSDPMHNGFARIPDPADREPDRDEDCGCGARSCDPPSQHSHECRTVGHDVDPDEGRAA